MIKDLRCIKQMCNVISVSSHVKRKLYEIIVLARVIFEAKTWGDEAKRTRTYGSEPCTQYMQSDQTEQTPEWELKSETYLAVREKKESQSGWTFNEVVWTCGTYE